MARASALFAALRKERMRSDTVGLPAWDGNTIDQITEVVDALGRQTVLVGRIRSEKRNPISRLLIWIYGPILNLCLRWKWTVLFLAIVGLVWGLSALGSFDVFGIDRIVAHMRAKQLAKLPFVVRGPYRWVRHPLYFFMLLLIWSCPVLTADRLLFNILWTVWVVIGTRLEERDLTAEFGVAYTDYQNKVPMLIPWRLPAK